MSNAESTPSVTTEYVSAADTAKLIRQALKAAFPATKFRVRIARGGATYIDWTDGPREADVAEVWGPFEQETFDGMQDMRVQNPATLYANEDGSYVQMRYLSGLIIAQRRWSDAVRDALTADAALITDGATGLPVTDYYRDTFAWREFAATTYEGSPA